MLRALTFQNAPAFEITKSYRDENGQMFIEGIAATTSIDLTGERMSEEVLLKMAKDLLGKPLRDEHQKGWHDKIGEIIQADVRKDDNNNPALWIKARLHDWSSKARDLFAFLKEEGTQMGLSVAGKINPGGLVKELVEAAGKLVPTYKDVEPTEVSVTDHPANLDTFAYAVAKSLHLEDYNPDAFLKEEDGTLEDADFLDEKHHRYPATEKFLLPALRYFNQPNQMKASGYDEKEWSVMGLRLAERLHKMTGDDYTYDPEMERVVRKTVNDNNKGGDNMGDKGNLVSKTIPENVKSFAKEWGNTELGKEEVQKTEGEQKADEVKKVTGEEKKEEQKVEKGSSSSGSTPGGSFPTVGDSSSSSSGSSSTGSSSNDMASLLNDLKSVLSEMKDSLDSGSSDSSSTDSSGSTSTSKAAEKNAEGEESDEEKMQKEIDSLILQAQTMRAELEKRRMGGLNGRKGDRNAANGSSQAGQSSSSVDSTASTAKSFEAVTKTLESMQKALIERDEVLQKLLAEKAEVEEKPNQRKGYAIAMEKRFTGHSEVQDSPADDDIMEKMKNDPEVTFAEFHKYRDFGILPAKYAKKG